MGRRRRREANSVCPARPLSPQSAPARPASPAPTLRPGARQRRPFLTFSGLRAEAARWPLPRARLKARTRARVSGEVQGGTRHAQQRSGDAPRPLRNNPKEFSSKLPIALRHLCVCERGERRRGRARGRERGRGRGVRSPDTDSRRGLNWSHLQPLPPPQTPTYTPRRSSADHINTLACAAAKDASLPPAFSSKGPRQTPEEITGGSVQNVEQTIYNSLPPNGHFPLHLRSRGGCAPGQGEGGEGSERGRGGTLTGSSC